MGVKYSPHIGGSGEDLTRTALSPNTTTLTLTQDHRIRPVHLSRAEWHEICARESSQRDSKDRGGTPPPRISTNRKLRSARRANRLRPVPTTCVSDMSLFTHSDRWFSSANVALRLILWIVNRAAEAWRSGLVSEFLTSRQVNKSTINYCLTV